MKLINHVLLVLLFLNFYSNVNSQIENIIFQNYTLGSPYFNLDYRGIITPFSPGGVSTPIGYQYISFNFLAYSSTLQQTISVNFYDQNSQLKFKVDDVLFQSNTGGHETTGPIASSSATSVATLINNDQQNKNSIRSLNAAQDSYSMGVFFKVTDLVYPNTNSLPEYLTIGFDIPLYGSVTFNFTDHKITFNAPAYNASSPIFIINRTEIIEDFGDNDYCKSIIILDGINTSNSYGLYYVQDSFNNSIIPLNSIKSPSTDGITKYYFLSRYQRQSSLITYTYTIYDAITGQSSLVSTPVTCLITASTLPADLIFLNSQSKAFRYVNLITPKHVNSVFLNGAYLSPTSFRLSNGDFSTLIRVPIQAAEYKVTLPIEQISATLQGSTDTLTSNGLGVKVVQLTVANVLIDKELKLNYTNSQLRFYVSINSDESYYGKVASIDFQIGGVVFYSDKEVVGNIYKKIVYIPDNLIGIGNELIILLNTELYSRINVFSFNIINSISTASTKTLSSTQDMYMEYGKKDKYFINAFNGNLAMGSDYNQIPNIQMSYYTVNKTTSFPYYNDDVKIESNYPFGYTGYFSNLKYQPSVPLMPDTPGSAISCDPSYPYLSSVFNDPLLKRDYISPNIFANFTFSTNLNDYPDRVFISLDDSIGISSIKPNCKVSLGPNVFILLPPNIYTISENNFSNTIYQFNFNFNRYFCGSKINIDCTDIRGNRIYHNGETSSPSINNFFSAGLNECPSLNLPNVLSLIYTFNSATSVTINALFSQIEPTLYSIKVLIYDNYENIGTPVATYQFQLENSYSTTQSSTFKALHSETLTSSSPSVKRFISIAVTSLADSSITYTLSTKELEYLNEIYMVGSATTQIVASQFTIRNLNYYDLSKNNAIDILDSNLYSLSFSLNQIVFTSYYSDLIKTITFVFRDYAYPKGLYLNYDSTNSNSYKVKNSTHIIVSLPKSLDLYSKLYIESFCDFYNNCFELGPYSTTIVTFNGPKTPLPTTSNLIISNPKFSRNYIDISSNNRKVKVSIDLSINSSPFVQSSILDSDPLFYVTERDSNDQISCPLKQVDNTATYSCDLEIPFMFGSRGLGHCSIYNIIYDSGYINGTRFDTCQLFLYNQYLKYGPVITEISAKMYDTTLYFYGINLNLLDSMIQDKSIFSTSTFTFINSTSGYYELKEKLVKPMDITIGTNVYSVFIYTCLKDDCSGNGNCNMTTLTCSCNQGWGGTDCSIDQTFACKNNCSGNGLCSVDMTCNCNTGYTGVSCEIKNSNLTMNMNTSNTSPSVTLGGFNSNSLNNFTKTAKFQVELLYIQEVDLYGKVINRFNLNESNWSLLESSNNNQSNTFNTTLLEYSEFIVKVDIFKEETQMTWANEQISIPANSIKYSVRISNYTFSSNLNRLEMFYQATPNSELECAIKQQIAWGAKRSTDMHWVTLPNNQLQLYGRFSNNLIVDDKIVSNSNEGLEFGQVIQVKVNIPFFKDYVELDPDFSVLVDVNMDETIYDECGNIIDTKSNKKKWVIPVAVIVSVVGATVIFIAVFSIAYKKNISLRAKILAFKSRVSNNGVSMKNFN